MKLAPLFILVFIMSCGKTSAEREVPADPVAAASRAEDGTAAGPGGPGATTTSQPDSAPQVPAEGSAPLEAGMSPLKLDATSATDALYITMENGVLVKTSNEQAWLFAVKRTQFQTNSGTSGPLNVGVFNTESTDYTSIKACEAGSLTYDTMLPASGAPGSQAYSGNALLQNWYNYDPVTHVVSSKKLVYLFSDGSNCFKFQILSYASGLYEVLADALPLPARDDPPASAPAPTVYEQSLDATSTVDTVYLKLEQGQLVVTTIDQPWLLAVKRTQFQTNSGTSGTRGVGTFNSASTDFAAVSSCMGLAYSYDEIQAASGAPGSQPYSGNAVLNAWYDYDFASHTVRSKQLVYMLFDGTECMKLQILNYASGVYTVKVSQL